VPADRQPSPRFSRPFGTRYDGARVDTIYAAILENRYEARSPLRFAEPEQYNTYKHAGLPPGPMPTRG